MVFKEVIVLSIFESLNSKEIFSVSKTDIEKAIEIPPQGKMGDYAFPCFLLASIMKKSPAQIAAELGKSIQHPYIEHVDVVGPYVNFFLNRQAVGRKIIDEILKKKARYGDLSIGQGENITIDLSSPNIAKPFSMGHLRSTVIGNALANIVEKCGFTSVKINHLGDWGTQFGKLITAYKMWGDEERVKANPIQELLALYVRFHEEAEKDFELEEEGRHWFKKLEDGDEEALYLWKWFRTASLKEFGRIYQLLGIEFDSYHGEAFYNDKMEAVIKELEEKNLLTESDGAMVVRLEESNLPPCLIKKSDGATLYATRDLAAALYRKREYHFAKSFYVVGGEQALHFKQLFLVLKKMGYTWADELYHIPFGMMLKDGKKMSTRKGKIVLLEEVLHDAIKAARDAIESRNPNLENKDEIARMVGVGAVIFHDLKNDRLNDIEFSLEAMLTFEGETGPYLQYTYARTCSLLRKSHVPNSHTSLYEVFEDDKVWPIIFLLSRFEEVIASAFFELNPSRIAKYLLDLSQQFNKYYGTVKILEENDGLVARLKLVKATSIVLREGLRLLGIGTPERM
ncbi:Arginine-tRNA ligase 2 [Caldibacillus thermoamylovorans]|jgi:arginyl-tRNA synthetase|uniref:Arginine--tRNA ligase n=1 Tax=Caldibacillus thermoamylovorans TaxID=35841 RepID=A0A090KQN1_9BACI|nr:MULTISPECIES: arginine--tRNA ligase [Bacillaceae]KIO62281.1 Arginyl-tRNA synthetase [Caldibacillus thermoamylovorans]PAC37234.1 arginine--tRNA ligase [Caldifermentibacillus hisashii]CEE00969.1 Arginine-tRNA ligase 2 [Caldibacillus thermoamylovorans]